MAKLLSIIGPTATGKTTFALEVAENLAEKFPFVDVISADSRQLFLGMKIGTGVDLPAEFKQLEAGVFPFPFYQSKNIRIHGIEILKPDENWSLAQFQAFTQTVLQQVWREDSLPILVGGTGLYHHQLFQADEKLRIPPNPEVREKVAPMSVAELQQWLQKLQPQKFAQMNHSDQYNSRRLVRAIEVSLATNLPQNENATQLKLNKKPDQMEIGLTDSIENITSNIQLRVQARWAHGMREEVQKLISDYPPQVWQHSPAFSATGYKEVRAFLEDQLSQEEMLTLWIRREIQYAKRQLTWFKKYAANSSWFSVHEPDWQRSAMAKISSWVDAA